jgi:hypothetical protein
MDAKVLDAVHRALSGLTGLHMGVTGVYSEQIAERYDWPVSDVLISFEILQAAGLCASASAAMMEEEQGRPKQGLLGSNRSCVVETEFGKRFLAACTPPSGARPRPSCLTADRLINHVAQAALCANSFFATSGGSDQHVH